MKVKEAYPDVWEVPSDSENTGVRSFHPTNQKLPADELDNPTRTSTPDLSRRRETNHALADSRNLDVCTLMNRSVIEANPSPNASRERSMGAPMTKLSETTHLWTIPSPLGQSLKTQGTNTSLPHKSSEEIILDKYPEKGDQIRKTAEAWP